MKTLVVAAHNNENLDWVEKLAFGGPWSVIVNSKFRPPGRESHAILMYFQNREHSIPNNEEIVFCQGNPFDHDPDFLLHLNDPCIKHFGPIHECDPMAGPSYQADMNGWCDVLGLEQIAGVFRFSAGSQYRITGAHAHSRPWSLYSSMLELASHNPKAPWVYERLWPIIWGITL